MIENKMAQLFPQKIKKRERIIPHYSFTSNLLYCLHLFLLLLTKLVVAHRMTQALIG